ncbi:MAG: GNAT family N-acetyltransferase [Chloroflexota bacterium]
MAPRLVAIRSYVPTEDAAWAESVLDGVGGRVQVRRGELVDVLEPGLGFMAERDHTAVGLLTYRLDVDAAELSSIVATPRRTGSGSALLAALVEAVRAAHLDWIWVVTTNDNVDALRFYQRRGFRIGEVRVGAVDRARKALKPSIARLGEHGIPLRDEIELVLDLRLES